MAGPHQIPVSIDSAPFPAYIPPSIDMNAVKATLDIMSPRDPLVKKLKAEELFTLSYLKQLDQSGYIDQLYQSK